MRRAKASLIYRRTKSLPAVQLLLAHPKLQSTVRYLDIEVDDALEMAQQTGVRCIPAGEWSLPGQNLDPQKAEFRAVGAGSDLAKLNAVHNGPIALSRAVLSSLRILAQHFP